MLLNKRKLGIPIAVVSPTEGTGYEVGSMSIIKGARNMKEAKIFADWAIQSCCSNFSI